MLTNPQYHYDPLTGEYVGVTEQYLDKLGGDPYPVLASFATPVAPPDVPMGKAAVFLNHSGRPPLWYRDGVWQLIDDLRGNTYWLIDGSEHVITTLGQLPPAGALTRKPVEAEPPYDPSRDISTYCNDLAQSWGYDDYKSARCWLGDPNPKFNAEAQTIVSFTSACFTLLDEIETGARATPSDKSELLALLPSVPERPFSQ